ncbi:PepSY domain-containing protein [Neobacillus massiliamazoniensis]|jgi:hypothetical protein|uniref:Propeptide PepSY amd peptidase M4 n=1 Tax=Neobacillus massiliamazoniensis TaxID=1499688 RepID=A0A0U1NSP9_9BACI|nr:PepSY domain-containing protein [Neobacillus massiliamazoniensis]CRK81074.1 propeptide PepSY amd peptidase M4 [Neobacillus massiliamazoniensis]
MKKWILVLLFIFPISFGSNFYMGAAKAAQPMQPGNKRISENEAKNIALKKVKGEVVKVVLEEDDGRAVYEVKVKSSGIIYEIEIDAMTGQVLEVEKEGHHGDGHHHDGDDHHHDDDHLDD